MSNLGFHAPPNHPGIANDGTAGNAGFSNAAWTSNQTAGALSWSSETFAQNPNANAIRWGHCIISVSIPTVRRWRRMRRSASSRQGAPITVGILAPDACNATPTPYQAPTPRPTPTPDAQPKRNSHALQRGRPPSPTRRLSTSPMIGAATPYPSNIEVASSGTITKVTVKLNSLSNTFPADIDVLLVGPGRTERHHHVGCRRPSDVDGCNPHAGRCRGQSYVNVASNNRNL